MAPRFHVASGLLASGLSGESTATADCAAAGSASTMAPTPPTLTFGWDRPAAGRPPVGWASLTLGAFGGMRAEDRRPPVALFSLAEAKAPLRLRRYKIEGDGRCMFRALAQGMARNKGAVLKPSTETTEADQLRLAVAEALCRTPKRRNDFKEAVKAVQAEDNLPRYCQRLESPSFWGGEPELLVLSKMLKVPLVVYMPEDEMNAGNGYVPIMRYGEEYLKAGKDHKARKPVRLLFCGGNHYDLLLKQ
eukprot:jgi/Tetstr1/443611/TSEL_031610.t1